MFARGKTAVSWKDMAVGRLIRIPASTQFGGLMLEAAQHQEEVGPGCITVTTNLLALKLAERGVGLAAIDSFTAAQADLRKVQVLPIQPEIRVQLTLVRRNEAKLSHAARRFMQVFASVAEEATRRTLAGGAA
jgi:DNA-binding transcriptional LysR family regulator